MAGKFLYYIRKFTNYEFVKDERAITKTNIIDALAMIAGPGSIL